MKRTLVIATLAAALFGCLAPTAPAAPAVARIVADDTVAHPAIVLMDGDTSWGGACETPQCKPLS
ncbi:hypothetical protein ABT095_27980 [Kitasatospora sp. NPDC002227]|uniref:hypothetical protein n=1 Tax=Kitasatospora sp. NPDC002227 TaxID=3154773 RepID=UPI0033208B6B